VCVFILYLETFRQLKNFVVIIKRLIQYKSATCRCMLKQRSLLGFLIVSTSCHCGRLVVSQLCEVVVIVLCVAVVLNDVEDVRPVLEFYSQFDDPLTAFRDKQRQLQVSFITVLYTVLHPVTPSVHPSWSSCMQFEFDCIQVTFSAVARFLPL